ncbi:class I SAM-dependent DNA methyltransferase [Streptomyces sp. NPDC001743]|uniref:type I restriction-modification system subunit M n=1 Tax=Streptomyces sp. NPDC001743 TaxID=3154397 RepID=UPI0033172E45
MSSSTHAELSSRIWAVSELLRGDFKQSEYGRVILPFLVLRRLECVLAPTKDAVLAAVAEGRPDSELRAITGAGFCNTSPLALRAIAGAGSQCAEQLLAYCGAFSPEARDVLEQYAFGPQVERLAAAGLLHHVVGRFAELDLQPAEGAAGRAAREGEDGEPRGGVSNHQMGYLFEELIRRWAEQSHETAGEHFTPPEVVRLMVNLLATADGQAPGMPGAPRTVLDPACGTGGMLSAAQEQLLRLDPDSPVEVFGQELNPESWAICRSDMMLRGQAPGAIVLGNSLTQDGHAGATFDYLLANPPFGVDWRKAQDAVEREHQELGERGRFGAGLPRVNDGALLFLQHMIAKMKPADASGSGGSRIAILFNGSPLFSGQAGSGESRIRQWILENDLLEGIVALPDQLFYNTGISTYVWVLTNRKAAERKGGVVLLDARDHWRKMRRALGDKRKELGEEHIAELTRLYAEAPPVPPAHAPDGTGGTAGGKVKIFRNEDFGYRRITVERPLRLRFEASEASIAQLAAAKPVQRAADAAAFAAALRPLTGSTWATAADALDALTAAVVSAGLACPSGVAFARALREAWGVSDPEGEVQSSVDGPLPDPALRDFETVPLGQDPQDYLRREVLPFVPDAWIDHTKTKVGYEIPFTRHFYVYTPPRPLAAIDADLRAVQAEIQALWAREPWAAQDAHQIS